MLADSDPSVQELQGPVCWGFSGSAEGEMTFTSHLLHMSI